MATHFSANQYQGAFQPVKLQNWECSKAHKERPNSQDGFTQVIANDRGHILPGVPRSKKSPWDTGYVNAWDMPKKIPGNCISVKTGRSSYAQEKLQREHLDAQLLLSGKKPDKCNEKKPAEGQARPEAKMLRTPSYDARQSGAKAPSLAPGPMSPPPVENWWPSPDTKPLETTEQEQDCTAQHLIAV